MRNRGYHNMNMFKAHKRRSSSSRCNQLEPACLTTCRDLSVEAQGSARSGWIGHHLAAVLPHNSEGRALAEVARAAGLAQKVSDHEDCASAARGFGQEALDCVYVFPCCSILPARLHHISWLAAVYLHTCCSHPRCHPVATNLHGVTTRDLFRGYRVPNTFLFTAACP
jgi:hypothetical protein